jgi:hypothetical protein
MRQNPSLRRLVTVAILIDRFPDVDATLFEYMLTLSMVCLSEDLLEY